MSKTEPHPKDVGRKPGKVLFEEPKKPVHYPHVDPHDGYLFVRTEEGGVEYLPWHRVRKVVRDV